MAALKQRIAGWSRELGFQQCGISDIDLATAEQRLGDWLRPRFHGSMQYMERHGLRRSRPQELVAGTVRVISVRMDYLPESQDDTKQLLDHASRAYISRYALGRDYHKVLRGRLRELARRIETEVGTFGCRVFVDSAPVLEKAIAEKAGLGWIGKHTNLIDRNSGSWFFLGELYTELPLPVDEPEESHCGTCTACLDVCPTQAIVAPYQLDARRCISYLTIESLAPIPVEFRKAIGNRIYGCDDCQLVCPWNRFARLTREADFEPRHGLDSISLLDCYRWDEDEFLHRTEGSAIRRIGHQCWLRNIVVALGNAAPDPHIVDTLKQDYAGHSGLVQIHLDWAIKRQESKL
jgi:epoxyqueuosine reductase